MSRADRMYALDHLGLPQGFQPSRASSLKLAQTLDADSIVVGSYTTDGTGIVAEAQAGGRAASAHEPGGERARRDERHDRRLRLAGVEADPAARPRFSVAEETFVGGGQRRAAGRLRAVHPRHHGAGPGGAAAASGAGGEAEPGVRPGMDGAGPRGLQRPAVRAGGRGICQGGSATVPDGLEAGFYRGLVAAVFGRLSPRPSRRLPTWRACCRWPKW